MAKIMNAKAAIALINDGDVILAGGFLGIGTPEPLVDELIIQGQNNLSIICNDGGSAEGKGIGRLVSNCQVNKFICSWFGYTPAIGEQANTGALDLELNPQGTLVERIRAGGFGLGGVLTPAGLDTMVEEKWGQRIHVNGSDWLYHTPLRGNVALVEAYRADTAGNLVFRRVQRNFAPAMCFAADLVIAAVVNPIEPIGNIDPDEVVVPGIVVDILVPQQEVSHDE